MPELDPTKRRLTWTVGRAANRLQPRSRRAPLAISQSQYEFSQITQFFQGTRLSPKFLENIESREGSIRKSWGQMSFLGKKGAVWENPFGSG